MKILYFIIVLCFFSTLQKLIIHAPLSFIGYIVPILFGGLAGYSLGLLIISQKNNEGYWIKLENFMQKHCFSKKFNLFF